MKAISESEVLAIAGAQEVAPGPRIDDVRDDGSASFLTAPYTNGVKRRCGFGPSFGNPPSLSTT